MTESTAQLTDFEPGSQFDGFTIEKQIGEGGMARLFLAHDEQGRSRVLKVPHRTLDSDPVAVVAFENELRLARYLEDFPHAHMPVPHKGGECHYLVMDYIEGNDLWTHLCEQGCMNEAQTITLVKKIVSALSELHNRRIVHLDIKLSNIMITPNGEIRIIDFGLANHLDLPDMIYESFQEPKGTPAYIAPEQFFGVRDEPRSDLFSIGTMLYEMTTSKLPFPDAHSELGVINRIKGAVISPRQYRPELSQGFANLVMTCLQNIPDQRYENMDALYTALEELERVVPQRELISPALNMPVRKSVGSSAKLLARITSQFIQSLRSEKGGKLDEIKEWIDKHKEKHAPRFRIIAALDNEGGERAESLNQEILSQAFRQASLQSSLITVLTVLKDHNVALASTDRERKELNKAYQDARESMIKITSGFVRDDLPIGINIRSGEPVSAISNCVSDLNANLLVIGTRKRNALSRFVLGSTAYKVITTLSCPVIIVNETEIGKKSR